MRSVSGVGRVAAIAAVVVAILVAGVILFGGLGGGGYTVYAQFQNAGQLVKGNLVQIGGTKAGTIKNIELTQDGQARVKMQIDGTYKPLRVGTKAVIRQASLSGIANRFVELMLPPAQNSDGQKNQSKIPDGGEIGVDQTTTAVDLDQLFNTLDPITRVALQQFFKGGARQYKNYGPQANRGFQYLDPALSTSRRLFNELNADTPLLERFLVDSARFMTTVADRRDDLAALIANLNSTFRALGNQKEALADAISRLPDFMRTANTTFVDLRNTLDVVDPLVDASKPVARKLGPCHPGQRGTCGFLNQLRGLVHDARPTVRDLNVLVRRPGADNDLTELNRTFPPLASMALDTRHRKVNFLAGLKDVGRVRGSFPENAQALRDSAPIIAQGRPYTPDLMGWFDDFSNTGDYDALGGISRAHTYVVFAEPEGAGGPVPPGTPLVGPVLNNLRGQVFKQFARIDQYRRCPGASEEAASDSSNVFSSGAQSALDCRDSDRATGPR
jgi:phospholipid/cholesterol/gamma-HCH transport system substrate-binding protein